MKEKWESTPGSTVIKDVNGNLIQACFHQKDKRIDAIITEKEIILQTDTKIKRIQRKTSQLNLPPGEVTKKD